MAQNDARAFHEAQSTDPGDACLFLANLDNQLTDDELWEKIHGEVTTLGLESAILVTRKTSPRGNVKPSAHVQFKSEAETQTAMAHLNGLLIGAGLALVGPDPGACIRQVRADHQGGKYAIFDYRPGIIFELKTVEMRRDFLERFRAEQAVAIWGKYVLKGGYKFWTP